MKNLIFPSLFKTSPQMNIIFRNKKYLFPNRPFPKICCPKYCLIMSMSVKNHTKLTNQSSVQIERKTDREKERMKLKHIEGVDKA